MNIERKRPGEVFGVPYAFGNRTEGLDRTFGTKIGRLRGQLKMGNRAAFVTGAARGIGFEIAVELARRGFDVIAGDVIDLAQLKDKVAGLKRKCYAYKLDISDPGQRTEVLDKIRKEAGRIDALVNNAGVAPKERADILEATEESFDRLVNINLKGTYFLTQSVARYMIESQKEILRPGAQDDKAYNPVIINISSMSSYTSSVNRGDYCISKAGISMVTKLFADRLAEYGISVFEVRPGIIETDMTAKVKEKYDKLFSEGVFPIKRWGKPQDVAKAVASIAEGNFPYSTGDVINVDGGFHLRRM